MRRPLDVHRTGWKPVVEHNQRTIVLAQPLKNFVFLGCPDDMVMLAVEQSEAALASLFLFVVLLQDAVINGPALEIFNIDYATNSVTLLSELLPHTMLPPV